MPTTTGQPERRVRFGDDWDDVWQAPWTIHSLRERGGDDYGLFAEERAAEARDAAMAAAEQAEPAERRRSAGATLAAIADAMGVEQGSDELADVGWVEPEPELPETPAAPSPAPEVALAYRVREGDWRESKGIGRRRKSIPPSRTPEARRLRHLQALVDAGKFGSIHDANLGAPQRLSFGKPKRKPARAGDA